MSFERLNYIAYLLRPTTDSAAGKIDKHNLRLERDAKAEDLHRKLAIFHKLMADKRVGNQINLGTKAQTINWEVIPEAIAACFRPEFGYQPEEITAFYISSTDNNIFNGEFSVSITLERGHRQWSCVKAGAIVRLGHHGDATSIKCLAEPAQPKEAREAMKSLKYSLLWERQARGSKDKGSLHLSRDLNGLQLTETVLNFAVAKLEGQLTPVVTF